MAAHPEAWREVFLMKLPKEVTEHQIAEVLKKFGALRRNSVKTGTRDNRDGSYTCFALVEFQSPDSARLAVEARFVYIGRKNVKVEYKKAGGVSVPPEVTIVEAPKADMYVPEAGRGVFVSGLPRDATKNMVAAVLRKFGRVTRQTKAVQIWTKENYRSGSYTNNALVEFESPDSARLALEAGFVNFGEKEASLCDFLFEDY